VSKVWRLSWVSSTDGGVELMNTQHVQTDLGIGEDEPSAANVADAIDDHYRDAYKDLLSTNFTLVSLETRECLPTSSTDVPESHTTTINEAGTLAVGTLGLPNEICGLIKLKTAAASRSSRGYIVPPSPQSITALDTGRLWATAGGYWAALQAFAALLTDVIDTGGVGAVDLNPVVYSRTRHNASEDPFTFQVTQAIATRVPHWRRSRSTAP
jgi:hypothetical protein